MKKIAYLFMLCVIVFAFASCGAEDLLGDKYIKFTLDGRSYTFSGNPASDAVGPVAVVAGDLLTITASEEGNAANFISFAGNSSNGSWAGATFLLTLHIGDTAYTKSDVSLGSLKVEGELAIKVLTATFNITEAASLSGNKNITGGKINVRYGTSSTLGI